MEKKTILAIVLSVMVIVVYSVVMQVITPPDIPQNNAAPLPAGEAGRTAQVPSTAQSVSNEENTSIEAGNQNITMVPDEVEQQYVTITTDYLDVRLTNKGGDIVSFKLKEHDDGDSYVDMILAGEHEPHAFAVAFGGRSAAPLTSNFHTRRISDYQVEFYRDFIVNGSKFTLKKKYTFVPGEYMFELDITIEGGSSIPQFSFDGAGGRTAYTLSFGPQTGPKFKALDEREEYRHYFTQVNGKRKDAKVSASQDAVISTGLSWAAIAGKYFTLIAVPDSAHYTYIFSTRPDESGLPAVSRLFIERPPLTSSVQTDVYRFYLGPKTSSALDIYDTNKSYWKDLSGLQLSNAANTGGFWAILNPLEWILKNLLSIFFKIVPNYGIAIILVTLLVKVLLFPLTRKSSEGTLRMQIIAPKIKELQAKYKDNPSKLNVEMGALYKKEGYNPLSGCLPMLIQIPIFFAMYNLFNNHFDLRGAIFIPGWIFDLSQPEYIASFAPSKLPILGWSEFRVLPFIYVGSQLLYGKLTQTPDQQNNVTMKMMLYVMPVVFFFVLYNVPSGLLVYWIMSNILSMIQQLAINKHLAKKRAAYKETEEQIRKVIVPPKKKKRR